MTSAERIGANLRTRRQQLGLTQATVGEMIGSDGPRIGRLEKGVENPTVETLDKLAGALQVDVHELTSPRPEEDSGHGVDRSEGNPVFERILQQIDREDPAEDSWRGDVLKALAALTRALRRPDAKSGAA